MTEEVKPTDSIFMWAEGEEANKDWKWCKYGAHESTARGISDDEFIRRIQHEGKVLVVTSVSTGIRKYFSNGEVEKIEDNRWEMNDHDGAPACPKKAPKKYRVELVDIFGLHDLDEDND